MAFSYAILKSNSPPKGCLIFLASGVLMLKKIFLLPAVAMLAVFSLSAQEAGYIIQQASSALVRVEIYGDQGGLKASGSGFAYESGARVVTNAHVVESAYYDDSLRIVLLQPHIDGSEQLEAVILRFDRDLDLCILEPSAPLSGVLLPAADAIPELTDFVWVLGFPLGQGFKATPGSIQAVQDVTGFGKMLDLSATVAPGSSGGPVLNAEGRVIGVASATILGYNFNLAIPVRSLRSFTSGPAGRIQVSVNTQPHGARVFINGRYKGTSPLDMDLPGIPFNLSIQKDNYQEYHAVFDGSEDLDLAPELTILRPDEVRVTIESKPSGVAISVNNRELGETPLVITESPGKKLRIRGNERPYRSYFEEFYVSGNEAEQTIVLELDK